MKTVLLMTCILFAVTGAVIAREPAVVTYPALTGRYAVGRTAYHWVDHSRPEIYTDNSDDHREVPVTIWYPAATSDAPTAPWMDPVLTRGIDAQIGIPLKDIQRMITVQSQAEAPLAEADAPFPVLVMSHGSGLFPEVYTATAEALASQGYVVVGVYHPYNAFATLLSDGKVVVAAKAADPEQDVAVAAGAPFAEVAKAIDALGIRLLKVQVDDLRFVLNQLTLLNGTDTRFSGRLDTMHVGVFGHSFGGAAAFSALLVEPRFAAAAIIDGSLFADVPDVIDRPVLGLYTSATLVLPTEADIVKMGMPADAIAAVTNSVRRTYAVYDNASRGYMVEVVQAQHFNFTDAGLLAQVLPQLSSQLGTINPTLALDITNAYLLAFFDQTLRNAPSRLGDLPHQYPQSTLKVGGKISG